MERSSVTRSGLSASSRIFEEIGVVPQPGNLFHESAERLLRAAELVGLRHHQQIILAQPRSEVMVHFPVRMDDGHHRLFKGYRVQHSNALGPFLGGIRFSPRLSIDAVKAHAMLATVRAALVRVPFGGSFGGVKVHPEELSRDELMRLVRRYCSAIGHQLGPAYDVVAPDAGTGRQVMAWFFDTLVQTTPELARHDQSRAVVGKPVELGGVASRARTLAAGLLAVLDEVLGGDFGEIQTARVAVVGFGRIGTAVARALAMRGARITSVLSSSAALHDPSGLDVTALADHRRQTGGIDGFPAATALLERDFWEAPADLLVVGADDRALDAERAARCRARVVVEVGGANVTSDAEEVLLRRGIEIVPDLLASGGADVAASIECRGARGEVPVRRDDLEPVVRRRMALAARRVLLARQRYECDSRTAALCVALERIGRIYDLRGVFP